MLYILSADTVPSNTAELSTLFENMTKIYIHATPVSSKRERKDPLFEINIGLAYASPLLPDLELYAECGHFHKSLHIWTPRCNNFTASHSLKVQCIVDPDTHFKVSRQFLELFTRQTTMIVSLCASQLPKIFVAIRPQVLNVFSEDLPFITSPDYAQRCAQPWPSHQQ